MKSRWILSAVVFLSLGLLFFVHAAYYYPFLSDDALISLRYAQRFAAGRGLTWTDGPPVEGYSNLLWVLIASLGALVHVDVIVWVRTVAALCSAVLTAGILALRSDPADWRDNLMAFAAGLGLVLAPPLAIWSVGGLEQPLFAALAIGALVVLRRPASRRANLACTLLLGALALTRVDGVLFAAGMILSYVLVEVAPFRVRAARAAVLSLGPLAAFLGQLVFRLWYYGAWVSNTTLAKVTFRASRLSEGFTYCLEGLRALAPLLTAASLFLALSWWMSSRPARRAALERRSRVGVPLLSGAFWAAYIAFVGGDIFPGWRLLTPIYALAPLLTFELLESSRAFSWRRRESRRGRAVFLGAVLVAAGYAAVSFWGQRRDPENQRGKTERWEFAGEAVGLLLKRAFATEQPLVAVNAAGGIPYFSELPALDMLGLTDRYLATHPPATFGSGPIGHELGDGAYILRRAPDVVVVSSPQGSRFPALLSESQMMSMAEFFQKYTAIEWAVPEPFDPALLWLRRNSSRIGPRWEGATWFVPPYVFDGSLTARVVVDDQGVIGRIVEPGRLAVLESLSLIDGRWSFSHRFGGPLHLQVRDAATREPLAAGDLPLAVDLPRPVDARLELAPPPGVEAAPFFGLELAPPDRHPRLALADGFMPTLDRSLFWNLSTRSVAALDSVTIADQDMRTFGSGWNENDQLFGIWCGQGVVEFDFRSLATGRIEIELAFTAAPDFGDWRLSLDPDSQVTVAARSPSVEVRRRTVRGWTVHEGLNRLRLAPVPASTRTQSKWGLDTIRIRMEAAPPPATGG